MKSSSGVYLISNSPAIMSMETVSQILFENHATSMNIIFIESEVSILQIYVDTVAKFPGFFTYRLMSIGPIANVQMISQHRYLNVCSAIQRSKISILISNIFSRSKLRLLV